jgi:hypothetical protein
MFKREKSPLAISRPMFPDLGDYKDRPSIELGQATPAAALATPKPVRNFSQRKTDEGWSRYFQADNSSKFAENGAQNATSSSTDKGPGGFWIIGAPEGPSLRSPKMALRDSSGNALLAQTVAAQSPSMESGPADARARGFEVVQGIPAKISSGESVSSEGSHDDDYEDDKIDHAYSSGIPSSIPDHSWAPVGNTWSGPPQRPFRPPSSHIASAYSSGVLPAPSISSYPFDSPATKTSSIPSFPMPNSTNRAVHSRGGDQDDSSQIPKAQPVANHFSTTTTPFGAPSRPPRPAEDIRSYFDAGPESDRMPTTNPYENNLSWLNLNADPR